MEKPSATATSYSQLFYNQIFNSQTWYVFDIWLSKYSWQCGVVLTFSIRYLNTYFLLRYIICQKMSKLTFPVAWKVWLFFPLWHVADLTCNLNVVWVNQKHKIWKLVVLCTVSMCLGGKVAGHVNSVIIFFLLFLHLLTFFPSGRSKQDRSPENKAEMGGCEFSFYIRPKGKLFIGLQRLQQSLQDPFQRKFRGEAFDMSSIYRPFKH